MGTGGLIPAPEGYWAGDPEGAGQARRAADRGRGGDRLRPPRHAGSARRLLRHAARPDHGRQGPDQRLPAAVRRDRRREGLAGAGAGLRPARRARPRLDLFGAPELRRSGSGQSRHHRARGPCWAMCAKSAPTCWTVCGKPWAIIRW